MDRDFFLLWLAMLILVPVLFFVVGALGATIMESVRRLVSLTPPERQTIRTLAGQWQACMAEAYDPDAVVLCSSIRRLYQTAQGAVPRHILIVPSPAAAVLAHACLRTLDPSALQQWIDLQPVYHTMLRHYTRADWLLDDSPGTYQA